MGSTVSRERTAYIFGMKDRSVDMDHITRLRIPEDINFYRYRNENLRSHAGKPELILQTLRKQITFIEVGI